MSWPPKPCAYCGEKAYCTGDAVLLLCEEIVCCMELKALRTALARAEKRLRVLEERQRVCLAVLGGERDET